MIGTWPCRATLALLTTLCLAGRATADGELAKTRSVARGAAVYQHYCVLCHGASGRGNGRAARIHNPRPFDLTRSTVNNAYRELIIRRGGAKLGRSPDMPPWQDELSDQQIRDVIAFLGKLSTAAPARVATDPVPRD